MSILIVYLIFGTFVLCAVCVWLCMLYVYVSNLILALSVRLGYVLGCHFYFKCFHI